MHRSSTPVVARGTVSVVPPARARRSPVPCVEPRATVPTGYLQCDRDFLVAQLGERIEEERIPLPRLHRRECTRESGAVGRTVDPSRRSSSYSATGSSPLRPYARSCRCSARRRRRSRFVAIPYRLRDAGCAPRQLARRSNATVNVSRPARRRCPGPLVDGISVDCGEVPVEQRLERSRLCPRTSEPNNRHPTRATPSLGLCPIGRSRFQRSVRLARSGDIPERWPKRAPWGPGLREHDVLIPDVLGENLSGVEVLNDLAADHRGEHEDANG